MIDRSKLPNSFEFVVTAGARARQLLAGSTPRVAVGDHKKTTVAQQEVATKQVEKIERRTRIGIGNRYLVIDCSICNRYQSPDYPMTDDQMLIALGVSGGIGAYKAVEVARGLQKRGHEVVAVMTQAATRFVGPVTFEAITRRHVITDQFEPGMNADIEHIALASSIDLLLIAPATANIIGKLANGIADDFLSTLYTATRAPVLLAPAMNTQMFEHEAVRRNLDTLAARGVRFVEPGEGYLACGWIGKGRLAEPDEIVAAAEADPPARRAAARAARAGDGRADLRGPRSRCATSATDRAAGWGSRSPPKRRGAARR